MVEAAVAATVEAATAVAAHQEEVQDNWYTRLVD
jgi:hypothetical protein